MDFSLTEDQLALRAAVVDVLGTTAPDKAWAALAGMGVFGAAVPEAHGGLGLSDVDLVPIVAELGYHAVPAPVAETMVAASLIVGDPRLPSLVDGSVRVAVCANDGLAGFDADLLLCVDDRAVRLVAPTSTTPRPSVDASRPLFACSLPTGGELAADPVLVRDRLLLATAAQLSGLGRRMLDLTVSYVGTRQQFGVPVGSFQAVKHQLADALVELEFAGPTVIAAAWALSTGSPDASRCVATAAVLASEAAQRAAKTAIQCHGAIGYTVEYELHRFAKRAWALAATIDVDVQLDAVAASLSLS